MNRVQGFRVALCGLGVALATAVPASRALQAEPQMFADIEAAVVGPIAAMMGGGFGPAHVGRGGPDGRGGPSSLLPPFIHLTEQQQDRIFELRHAQEPALRAQFKELRSAHEQLRTLALTDNYDEARARQIVARAAQANSEIELMRTRLQHAVFALLTPEQRKRMEECKPAADGAPPRGCLPPR